MNETVGVGRVEFEITIAATPERVWRAFVAETSRWWLKDFYAGGEAARGFIVEPRLGGRLYEDWGDGAGVLWYTVIGLLPPQSLELAGHLTPAFGGPAKTYLKLTFEPISEGRTRLRVEDSILGRVSPASLEQSKSGWELLFGEGLKNFVEANPD